MIPKIIHYCWFGKNPKPKLAKKCIKSWKKHCKDYQIIEWNEENFDIYSAPLYVRQAYEAKKWAFITDYVRLYAMTKFGGIYMDTDVEVLKNLDDFLCHEAFSGFENDTQIPTGIMACQKDFPLFVEMLRYYDDAFFIFPNGALNTTTNVEIITNLCIQKGLQQNNKFQKLAGFALYPNDVFCPIDSNTGELKKTDNTVAIHWFTGSWLPQETISKRKKSRKRTRRIVKLNNFKHTLMHLPNRIAKTILGPIRYEKIKMRFKKG